MAKINKAPMFVRLGNILTMTLLRAGIKLVGPRKYPMYLLTVRGRKSGLPRTIPIVIIHQNGKRYLASPYGIVDWVRNLRAAGEAILTRGRRSETVNARELPPREAALVLRENFKSGNPFARYFQVTADSSLEEFERAVVRHPVFELQSPQVQERQEAPAASQGEPQAERGEQRLLPSIYSAREGRMDMTLPSTRILVLGAGVAGLLFTLRLAGKVARESVQITLVDASDTFTVRPRLHEFATGQRVFRRSFAQILHKSRVQFLQARITSLDPSQRRVTVQDQQQQQHELTYDYLVYALGSMTDRLSVPGVAEYAYSLSARGPFSAEALREKLPAIAARGGQVVVCGGGATGIETAAQVASVYPQIKVSLLTQGALALSWGKSVADAIRRRLVRLGVEIVDQSSVRAVRTDNVALEGGHEFACDLCIWTAGFVVQPLAREAGLAVNERDQMLVDPFLRSVSRQEIYAIGDAASPVEDPGVAHVRMSAFTAGIMGAHGADCLSAILSGKTPKPLSFTYLAQAIALGRHHAIFFPLSADDRPRSPYITGWLGSFTREAAVSFVVTATLSQRRFPGLFAWLGKGRYEQERRRKRAFEERPSLPVHHLS